MWKWKVMGIEFDISRFGSVECTIYTFLNVLTSVKSGTSLSDDDLTREDVLICSIS